MISFPPGWKGGEATKREEGEEGCKNSREDRYLGVFHPLQEESGKEMDTSGASSQSYQSISPYIHSFVRLCGLIIQ